MENNKLVAVIALSIMLVLSSCSSDFLNPLPYDFRAPETYYQTEEELDLSLSAIYNGLQTLWDGSWTYVYGWEADLGYCGRTSLTAYAYPGYYNINASNGTIQNIWTTLYTCINGANNFILNVDNNKEINEKLRSQYKGEAYFLRGYYYFMLTQLFGPVPLQAYPTVSMNDNEKPNSSIREIYDQVIKDMEQAGELVADITELGYGGRVSKSAVWGILAKVNLTMAGHPLQDKSGYQKAMFWAEKVISLGTHELNPSYPDIFIKLAEDKYDIKESIWEVEFFGNLSTPDYREVGGIGSHFGFLHTMPEVGRSSGHVNLTKSIFKAYNVKGDMRRYWNISYFFYDRAVGAPYGAKIYFQYPDAYSTYPTKFRREYEVVTPKADYATPINAPILRFTDVLLMYAEADNELHGPTEVSIGYLNKIRRRAWSTGIDTIKITNGGINYITPPKVVFSGGGGQGVKANALVSGGRVTAITMDRDSANNFKRGSGFTTPPAVSFESATGTGAEAEVSIFSLNQADVKPEDIASKESFRKFIQDERTRELNFEGHRKFDLIRWGDFLNVMVEMSAVVTLDKPTSANLRVSYTHVTPRDTLWGIPTIEMINNPVIKQNPGWY